MSLDFAEPRPSLHLSTSSKFCIQTWPTSKDALLSLSEAALDIHSSSFPQMPALVAFSSKT
jgi:hypothetical protein